MTRFKDLGFGSTWSTALDPTPDFTGPHRQMYSGNAVDGSRGVVHREVSKALFSPDLDSLLVNNAGAIDCKQATIY